MRRGYAGLLLVSALAAQTQPTFYAAYQDGLDAEHQEQWKAAATAYRRAIELRPASAARILIYGNNLLKDYAPHTHLARCLLELGEMDAAQSALGRAAHYGEPKAEREAVAHALSQRLPVAPTSKESAPHLPAVEPAPKAHPTPVPAPAEPPPHPPSLGPAQEQPPITSPAPPPPALPEPARLTREPPPAAASVQPAVSSPPPEVQEPSNVVSRHPWFIGILVTLAGAFLLLRRRNSAPEETSFQDPKQLGPYRIERLLGRGGFASTYLAHHTSTGMPVALKLLHPYRHDDPEFLRRFRQEARLGTMLNHPNLVRMLDPGPETGPPWLAMEYVSGRRLDQKLQEDGRPSLPEFRRIALQIAAAMQHAHDLGIVHRDLKPGNVIFAEDQAKVMDFGISRIVDSNTLTTTYAFLGTPRYAAPEAQLKAQVSPAADRYSFGIILFEMLAGHPPFDGETPFEILAQHQKAPLPDLASLRPNLPPGLVDLIERLCLKDPNQRPGDEELIRILDQFAEPLPEG